MWAQECIFLNKIYGSFFSFSYKSYFSYFQVNRSHFLKGNLVLKCQAIVAAIYTASEEEDAEIIENTENAEPVILEKKHVFVTGEIYFCFNN